MTTKRVIQGKSASASNAGYFVSHGIKVAKLGKPQSETA